MQKRRMTYATEKEIRAILHKWTDTNEKLSYKELSQVMDYARQELDHRMTMNYFDGSYGCGRDCD